MHNPENCFLCQILNGTYKEKTPPSETNKSEQLRERWNKKGIPDDIDYLLQFVDFAERLARHEFAGCENGICKEAERLLKNLS